MSIETVKEEVLAANLDLVTKNLVISTWGNVSGYDGETGVMVIKASCAQNAESSLAERVPLVESFAAILSLLTQI